MTLDMSDVPAAAAADLAAAHAELAAIEAEIVHGLDGIRAAIDSLRPIEARLAAARAATRRQIETTSTWLVRLTGTGGM